MAMFGRFPIEGIISRLIRKPMPGRESKPVGKPVAGPKLPGVPGGPIARTQPVREVGNPVRKPASKPTPSPRVGDRGGDRY